MATGCPSHMGLDLLGGLVARQQLYQAADAASNLDSGTLCTPAENLKQPMHQDSSCMPTVSGAPGIDQLYSASSIPKDSSELQHCYSASMSAMCDADQRHRGMQRDTAARVYTAIERAMQRRAAIAALQQKRHNASSSSTSSSRPAGPLCNNRPVSHAADKQQAEQIRAQHEDAYYCSSNTAVACPNQPEDVPSPALQQVPESSSSSCSRNSIPPTWDAAFAAEFERIRMWRLQRVAAATTIQAAVRSWLARHQARQHICHKKLQQLRHQQVFSAWRGLVTARRGLTSQLEQWRSDYLLVDPWHAEAWGLASREVLSCEGWSGFAAAYRQWMMKAAVLMAWARVSLGARCKG